MSSQGASEPGGWKIGRCYAAGFEDGGSSHNSRSVGSFWKVQNARKGIVPWNLQKDCIPKDTLVLSETVTSTFFKHHDGIGRT